MLKIANETKETQNRRNNSCNDPAPSESLSDDVTGGIRRTIGFAGSALPLREPLLDIVGR